MGAALFVLTYVSLFFLGPSRYVLHPVHAMGLALGGSCIAFFVVLLLKVRAALTLPPSHQAIHIVVVVLLGLVPVRAAVTPLGGFLLETVRHAATSRDERMQFATALTEAEQRLREGARLDLAVGVERGDLGRGGQSRLIVDLEATGVFDVVGRTDEMTEMDLVATAMARHVRPTPGQAFRLALSTDPMNAVNIRVVYTMGGEIGWAADRELYLHRLAVEVIKAVTQLTGRQPDVPH